MDIKETKSVKNNPKLYDLSSDSTLKNTMSVPEMRKLLGLKKTESYWLIHRNFFETKLIDGKMRVDIESFEKWYANQVKHKKVTGEKPGKELKKKSYSFREAANLLGVMDSTVYDIWRNKKLETIVVDYVKRIPIEVFEIWYSNQTEYTKRQKLPDLEELKENSIELKDAAILLGITREKLSSIIRSGKYKKYLEVIIFENKKWIPKKGFQMFLDMQDVYQVRKKSKIEILINDEEEIYKKIETGETITRQDASVLAGVNASTITKWIQCGKFQAKRVGKVLRINRNEFLLWLKDYKKGEKNCGIY